MFRIRIPRVSAEKHVAEAEDLIRSGIDRLSVAHTAALDEQHSRGQAIEALSKVIADHQTRTAELDAVKANIGRRMANLRGILGDQ